MTKKRVAVLISGRGSNLQALLDAQQDAYEIVAGRFPTCPSAEGLIARATRALKRSRSITNPRQRPRSVRARPRCAARRAQHRDRRARRLHARADAVLRARLGGPARQHPSSLLPKYPGINTHARALEAGDTEHGCTVHLVVEEVDAAKSSARSACACVPATRRNAGERVLELEHELYPRCLAAFAQRLS